MRGLCESESDAAELFGAPLIVLGGFRNLVRGMISQGDDNWCKFENVNPLHTWPRKKARLQGPSCVIIRVLMVKSRLAIKVPRGSSISPGCAQSEGATNPTAAPESL